MTASLYQSGSCTLSSGGREGFGATSLAARATALVLFERSRLTVLVMAGPLPWSGRCLQIAPRSESSSDPSQASRSQRHPPDCIGIDAGIEPQPLRLALPAEAMAIEQVGR